MTITVPKLKNHKPVLVAPMIQSYPVPKQWTWKDYLRALELQYNSWNNTMSMKDVNDLMQDICPGPYRVVGQELSDSVAIGLSLEFDDPKYETFWLLKNS
jgi:hypothetical protein